MGVVMRDVAKIASKRRLLQPWIVLLAAVLAMPVASTKYFLKGTKESNGLSEHSDLDGGSVVVQRYLVVHSCFDLFAGRPIVVRSLTRTS